MVINLHLERAVLSTIDYALTAEDRRPFTSPELRANLDRMMKREFRPDRVSRSGWPRQLSGGDDRCALRSLAWRAQPGSRRARNSPAVETWSSATRRVPSSGIAAPAIARRSAACSRALLVQGLFGKQLEEASWHDPDWPRRRCHLQASADRAACLTARWKLSRLALTTSFRSVDGCRPGAGAPSSSAASMRAGGHLGPLPGQGGQDGEVVHRIVGRDADHGHPAAGGDGDEPPQESLEEGLPRWGCDFDRRTRPSTGRGRAGRPAGRRPGERCGRAARCSLPGLRNSGADQFDI